MKKTIGMALVMQSAVVVSAAQPKFTQKELAYMPATVQIALFKTGVIKPISVIRNNFEILSMKD